MKYVSVGRRFVAVFIDGIIVGAFSSPFGDFQHVRTAYGNSYNIGWHGGGLFGLAAVTVIYYTLMEGAFSATAGKFVMGIRVVQENGSKVTWQGAIVRNLLRIIDAFPAYLIAAILVWTSPTRQRLGDRAANTVVIRKGSNTGAGMGAGGMPGTAWPSQPPGGVAIPPPPPPPPVGPPGSGASDQPTQ